MKSNKPDLIKFALAFIAITGAAFGTYEKISSSNDADLLLVNRVNLLEQKENDNKAAIQQLKQDVTSIKHAQLETSYDVRWLVTQFEKITKVTVKKS